MTSSARLIAVLAAALLAACGGGEGGDSGDDVLVRSTASASEPDAPGRFRADASATVRSANSPTGIASQPYRIRTCVTGTWRQTLRSPTTLRLRLSVQGIQGVQVVSNVSGVTGAENRIPFSGCAEVSSVAGSTPVFPSGSASVTVESVDNRQAAPVDGFDVTAELVVTRVQ